MKIVAAIRDMLAKNFTVEQALTAAEALEKQPTANALRQARYRARKRNSNVTVTPSHKDKETQDRLRAFGEGWNDLAAEYGLPQIDEIKPGSQRERHALARLREMPSPDYLWPFIRGSPYLKGEVNSFRCTFDWICNPTNFQKIKDGNYEPREAKAKAANRRY